MYPKCSTKRNQAAIQTLTEKLHTHSPDPVQNSSNNIQKIYKTGMETIPKGEPKDKSKRHILCDKQEGMKTHRGAARKNRHIQQGAGLSKEFRKSRNEDKPDIH